MAKLPSMQFYPGDWRKDPGVQALTYEERGVWFEMLLIMFESSERGFLVLNGQKMPDEALARMLGLLNQQVNQIVSKLIAYGVAKVEDGTGIIFCSRMVKDEVLRKTRSNSGKLGGNPTLLKQNPTTGVKQNPTPSSSSSSSSSISSSLKHNITLGGENSENRILSKKDYAKFFNRFETIWGIYPHKMARHKALEAFFAHVRAEGMSYYRELAFAVRCEQRAQWNAEIQNRKRSPPPGYIFFETGYKDYSKFYKSKKIPELHQRTYKL